MVIRVFIGGRLFSALLLVPGFTNILLKAGLVAVCDHVDVCPSATLPPLSAEPCETKLVSNSYVSHTNFHIIGVIIKFIEGKEGREGEKEGDGKSTA